MLSIHGIEKGNLVDIQNGIVFSHKEKIMHAISRKKNKTVDYHSKGTESESGSQIVCVSSYLWGLIFT